MRSWDKSTAIGKGTIGVEETLRKLKHNGIEHISRKEISNYIKPCLVCSKIRHGQGSYAASISSTESYEVMEVWNMDLMGPLGAPDDLYQHVLVVIDAASRWVELEFLEEMQLVNNDQDN